MAESFEQPTPGRGGSKENQKALKVAQQRHLAHMKNLGYALNTDDQEMNMKIIAAMTTPEGEILRPDITIELPELERINLELGKLEARTEAVARAEKLEKNLKILQKQKERLEALQGEALLRAPETSPAHQFFTQSLAINQQTSQALSVAIAEIRALYGSITLPELVERKNDLKKARGKILTVIREGEKHSGYWESN